MKFSWFLFHGIGLVLLWGQPLLASDFVLCANDVAQASLQSVTPERQALTPASLTVRLSDAEKKRLSNKTYFPFGSSKRQMARAFRTADWSDTIFKREDAQYLAYNLYRSGRITQAQFVTAQFFLAAQREFGNVAAVPLLAGDSLTPEAAQILQGRGGLTEEQSKQLIEKAAALPASERTFFRVHTEATVLAQSEYGLADATFRAFMGMHFHPQPDSSWQLVIPSLSLMQLYLDSRYGPNAMQLIPEFGMASDRTIVEQIGQQARVIVVPFTGIDSVVEGDGMYFGQTYAYVHDFYHAQRGSENVLAAYRALFPLFFELIDSARSSETIALGTSREPDMWDYIVSDLTNLEMESKQLHQYGPEPSVLDCFEYDFGPHSGMRADFGRIVLDDIRARPARWAPYGVTYSRWQERLASRL